MAQSITANVTVSPKITRPAAHQIRRDDARVAYPVSRCRALARIRSPRQTRSRSTGPAHQEERHVQAAAFVLQDRVVRDNVRVATTTARRWCTPGATGMNATAGSESCRSTIGRRRMTAPTRRPDVVDHEDRHRSERRTNFHEAQRVQAEELLGRREEADRRSARPATPAISALRCRRIRCSGVERRLPTKTRAVPWSVPRWSAGTSPRSRFWLKLQRADVGDDRPAIVDRNLRVSWFHVPKPLLITFEEVACRCLAQTLDGSTSGRPRPRCAIMPLPDPSGRGGAHGRCRSAPGRAGRSLRDLDRRHGNGLAVLAALGVDTRRSRGTSHARPPCPAPADGWASVLEELARLVGVGVEAGPACPVGGHERAGTTRDAEGDATRARGAAGNARSVLNFRHRSRHEPLQEPTRQLAVEHRIGRLDAEEEPIAAREREARHVEHRVIRHRQAVPARACRTRRRSPPRNPVVSKVIGMNGTMLLNGRPADVQRVLDDRDVSTAAYPAIMPMMPPSTQLRQMVAVDVRARPRPPRSDTACGRPCGGSRRRALDGSPRSARSDR